MVINQKGIAKTITPEITTHFDDDMIVMEKWIPKKPISAIYYNGEKEMFYVKRFLIENEGKEELFISDHPNSRLEIVSTDWRPIAEIEFTKERGKDRKDNLEVNLEEFIAVKGITAIGNQLTKEKVNQINLLDPLPFEAPEEVHADELEVVEEEEINTSSESNNNDSESVKKQSPKSSDDDDLPTGGLDDKGQITLF